MWQPTFDQVFKILTAAGGFGTFVWTVYTWRAKSLDDQAAARADAEKARKTRQIEATRPFLDRQLQLYNDVTQFAAIIASTEEPARDISSPGNSGGCTTDRWRWSRTPKWRQRWWSSGRS